MADKETPFTKENVNAGDVHPRVGVPHNEVVTSPAGEKEKIVYEFDKDGNFTGWHKEVGE